MLLWVARCTICGLPPWTQTPHDRILSPQLLVLGAEDSELAAPESTWGELLGAHGLGWEGDGARLGVLFVGPRVPARLDGASRTVRTPHGALHLAYLRGAWHEDVVQSRVPPTHATPQLALAFNSGLADYATGWLPTLRDLYWRRGVPLACTSYHQPEAELDARTLAVRAAVPTRRMHCAPNPFASRLPHLDELFPGTCYRANAFLTVATLPSASRAAA